MRHFKLDESSSNNITFSSVQFFEKTCQDSSLNPTVGRSIPSQPRHLSGLSFQQAGQEGAVRSSGQKWRPSNKRWVPVAASRGHY